MAKTEGQWLKFADFAREIGCTPANIYRYVKNHPEKLEPEVIKEGRFMVISPAGQEYIRSLMHPKTMSESAVAKEISRLQATLSFVDHKAATLSQELSETKQQLSAALFESGKVKHQLQLAEEAQAAHEVALADAKARADAAEEKAAQMAQEASERAQRDQETIRKLEKQLADEDAARAEAVARADALAKRGLIARIFNWEA